MYQALQFIANPLIEQSECLSWKSSHVEDFTERCITSISSERPCTTAIDVYIKKTTLSPIKGVGVGDNGQWGEGELHAKGDGGAIPY